MLGMNRELSQVVFFLEFLVFFVVIIILINFNTSTLREKEMLTNQNDTLSQKIKDAYELKKQNIINNATYNPNRTGLVNVNLNTDVQTLQNIQR